ncbi:MAG: type II toxin-antitoxin system VapC family toxin [Planctomycetota bacterium]|jgi:PIN domain nuclease of toxin-antitoxin system|nr:type II toxin-antitoxin system VapC family toxin [Planctomycetota bacterium]
MRPERFLLDTHIAVYALANPRELDRVVAGLLDDYADNCYVSTVSMREIIHLQKRGKIKSCGKKPEDIIFACEAAGFHFLPVNREHLRAYANLTTHPDHNDPNDHIIIAQAVVERMTLISSDSKFDFYTRQKLRLLFNRRG